MRNIKTLVCTALLTGLCADAASAQNKPAPVGSPRGFSAARLTRLDSLLDRSAQDGRIGGAVMLVLRDDHIVYQRAVGFADREANRRMAPDALFRIASQTKALTSVATLMLVEEGRVALSDPVSKFIPSFQRTTVAIRTDTGTAIVPARRQITVRDLLTHTSGVSYGTEPIVADRYRTKGLGPAAGFGWYLADKDEGVCETMDRLGTLPFVEQPGEAWVYGYSIDILGCVVEKASGVPFDEFIRTRITGPLGMHDTFFFVPPAKRDRLTAVYASDSTGHAVRAPDGPRGQGNYNDGPRRDFAGGAGLVSTAQDYARFLQMIAHRGAWNGQQFLAPHTVRLMTTNQVGTLHGNSGLGFGLGFETTDRYGANGFASEGSFGWGGAYGSTYLVDPVEGLVIVFMVQLLPNSVGIGDRVRTELYQALVDSRTH